MRNRYDLVRHCNTRSLFSSCGFYASAAYVQPEFGESAATNQVRLLYTTLQYKSCS